MNAGSRIRLTKTDEVNPGVVDIGYRTEGILVDDVRINESIWINRTLKDMRTASDHVPGSLGDQFNTSRVQKVKECGPNRWIVITRNSTWKLEVLG